MQKIMKLSLLSGLLLVSSIPAYAVVTSCQLGVKCPAPHANESFVYNVTDEPISQNKYACRVRVSEQNKPVTVVIQGATGIAFPVVTITATDISGQIGHFQGMFEMNKKTGQIIVTGKTNNKGTVNCIQIK